MRACTIIARNYLSHARVLAQTFLAHHPGSALTVLVVDMLPGEEARSDEPFTVMTPFELPLEDGTIHTMATIYDVTEFSTALKPTLLRKLLEDSPEPLVYLDPDIAVYGAFGELGPMIDAQGVVLTPHILDPVPTDGFLVREETLLQSGVFNLGFIGVGRKALEFLGWWEERTRWGSCIDPESGLFTDQRWIDFVPNLFDHAVIRDRGFNVAYWNLHERPLSLEAGQLLAGGRPVRFFHFSGYRADQPHLLSKHQGDKPRVLLSEHPVLQELCNGYRAALLAAGLARATRTPYRYGVIRRRPFDIFIRRLARGAFLHPAPGEIPPPAAFPLDTQQAFVDWLNRPVVLARGVPVTRLVRAIWDSRLDLQIVFPRPDGEHGEALMHWARTEVVFQQRFGTLHAPPPPAGDADRRTPAPGFNVIGYLNAELGVGESGRLMTRTIEHAGLPVSSLGYGRTNSRQGLPFTTLGPPGAPYDVNVMCVNADETPRLVADLGAEITTGRYRVGYWYWELPDFPATLHSRLDYVDEVWVASDFVRGAVQAATGKPVRVMPLPVIPGASTALRRVDLGLPEERFLFSFVFDYFSVLERKNPGGLVEAYRQAFDSDDGALLFLKSVNGHWCRSEREWLRWATADRPDILVHDGYFSSQQMAALTQLTDCYVSLHRSEGFGLSMASAMVHGKPVIATGWSGNMDFMTSENSLVVPFSLRDVGRGHEPYQGDSTWADPDVGVAAERMREVFDDPMFAAEVGMKGQASIQSTHSLDACAGRLRGWLDEAILDGRLTGSVGSEQVLTGSRIDD